MTFRSVPTRRLFWMIEVRSHWLTWTIAIGVATCFAAATGTRLNAQGVTTATIHGTVRTSGDGDVDGARVRIVNRATGYVVPVQVRRGQFLAQGLEVGGPYTVLVTRFGSIPQERDGLYLSLGQQLELEFVLEPSAIQLDTIRVISAAPGSLSQRRIGTGGTISDSLIARLPTLNRHVFDFVSLVPQVSTRFGISGGGVSYRFNSFLIDGVSERQLQGNNVAGGGAGGKAISVEAVKEFQVLLAPYDARYGDFAGALVNAVTRSGTNELHGTAFVHARNEHLTRATDFLRETPYDRAQFGFTVGGPIVRDRAHFFIASEFQRQQQPASGPYLGQSPSTRTPVPVFESDVTRFVRILRDYGIEAGSAGRVTRSNPNTNLFGRADVALPEWSSRLVLRHNHATFENTNFTRPVATALFPMSSNAVTLDVTRRVSALQLFTQLPSGAFNEFTVGYTTHPFGFRSTTVSPMVQVSVPGAAGTVSAMLLAGPPINAQGPPLTVQRTLEIADHLAVRARTTHTLGMGVRAELFSYYRTAPGGGFGRWTFSSLDSLERGEAASFRVLNDFGSARSAVRGGQISAYVNEEWQATDRFSIDLGLRADVLVLDSRPAYNPAVDSAFGRRTSDFPRTRVHWSPRLGFSWQVGSAARDRVRGGAGIFVGRPPLGWLLEPMRNDGMGLRTLSCSGGNVPRFVADARNPPSACANGSGFADGAVNLVNPHLEMAEMFRASLAYDRLLPWNIGASIEALYTRTLSDFLFANLNLSGPAGVDRHGRVLYGTIDTRGRATPAVVSSRFPEVIELRNHSEGYAYSLTGQLEKRFADRLEARASYTHGRVRDVQSFTREAALGPLNDWASGRTMSGRHEDITTGISSYDLPHRVVLAATWAAPWKRWATDLSVYYIGESGTPFTYGDSAASGLGDLNADGTNANDPIYVPRNTADTAEIVFDGTTAEVLRQQTAFERFIAGSECLRRQRGRIMTRNSCRGPWLHTTNASVRQSLPTMWGHTVSLQLDVFNLLNLMDKDWGQFRVPNIVALQQVRQTAGPTSQSQPVFRFDETRAQYSAENVESAYQIQLALRYRF